MVVIGSGIGGLAAAAILAKAGKRVLVLEQHTKAGGCCHTFGKNGLEFDTGEACVEKGWHQCLGDMHSSVLQCHLLFGHHFSCLIAIPSDVVGLLCTSLQEGGATALDHLFPSLSHPLPKAQFHYPCATLSSHLLTGIHYIGRMQEGTIGRFILDQITEGQLDWAPMSSPFDTVVLDRPSGRKEFPMYSGKKAYIEGLKEKFPQEKDVIDKYMKLVKVTWICSGPQFIPKTDLPP